MKKEKTTEPLVVIFGRTNVGKSTLFNRLIERHQAIVADVEGTTRDPNWGRLEWRGQEIRIVDTGGIMDPNYLIGRRAQTDDIEGKVQTKARDLIGQADLILFVTDIRSGLMALDREMARWLERETGGRIKIIPVANKADSPRLRSEIGDFHRLGLGDPLPVSATTGSGTGDLLDRMYDELGLKQLKKRSKSEALLDEPAPPAPARPVKIAIVGRPNAGKSSLLNSLIGEDRAIVSPVPHTTREPQDIKLMHHGREIVIVDTAGLSRQGQKRPRKAGKAARSVEKLGIEMTLASLKKADVVLFMIDLTEAIAHQDTKIADEIVTRGLGLVIIGNKWDLLKTHDEKVWDHFILARLPFLHWAPRAYLSAKTGAKVKTVIDLALRIADARKIEVDPADLKAALPQIVAHHRPTGGGQKAPRIRKILQSRANPPVFSVHIGPLEQIHSSYLNFLARELRERFGFIGVPLRIVVEKGKSVHGKRDQ